jgi:hypothetical protein
MKLLVFMHACNNERWGGGVSFLRAYRTTSLISGTATRSAARSRLRLREAALSTSPAADGRRPHHMSVVRRAPGRCPTPVTLPASPAAARRSFSFEGWARRAGPGAVDGRDTGTLEDRRLAAADMGRPAGAVLDGALGGAARAAGAAPFEAKAAEATRSPAAAGARAGFGGAVRPCGVEAVAMLGREGLGVAAVWR